MKIEKLPTAFLDALPLLKQIQAAGYEAYFVGGSVRDLLLHKKPHDVDIATSAYPAEIKKIFKRTVDTGIKHGTVTVLLNKHSYEITTFRTESGYQDFRRPDKVTFVRSLKEDLKRRDLTINAFAMDVSGQLIDLFNGLSDLQQGVIRAVGDPPARFYEDALRMMRAVRFASQLAFTIEPQTLIAIKQNAPLLQRIAVERIHEEWQKLLLGEAVKAGLQPFIQTGLYKYCPQMESYLAELQQLTALPQLKFDSASAAWGLFMYLAKMPEVKAEKFLKAWKSSNALIQETLLIFKALKKLMSKQNLTRLEIYDFGWPILQPAGADALLLGAKIDLAKIKEVYLALPIKNAKQLAINGRTLIEHLNVKPGPNLGKILKELERQVVKGNLPNDQEKLVNAAKKLIS
jgi:tRNA nucleotidyltransferase (CCA-adding enzyme)